VAAILQIRYNYQLKVGVDDGGGVGEDAWLGRNVQGGRRVIGEVVELNRQKLRDRQMGPWP
jgi:hypothetical protein